MADMDDTSERVATAVRDVLQNVALREAVLEFDEASILLTKGRRLSEQLPALENPTEYPDVRTMLEDESDSWLR